LAELTSVATLPLGYRMAVPVPDLPPAARPAAQLRGLCRLQADGDVGGFTALVTAMIGIELGL
jgi:hypothetical protein